MHLDALGGGDGSGGICSYLLRPNCQTKVIFNSILLLEEVDLRGSTAFPPSAIAELGLAAKRCVNFHNSWENPSDLSDSATWDYFLRLKKHLI